MLLARSALLAQGVDAPMCLLEGPPPAPPGTFPPADGPTIGVRGRFDMAGVGRLAQHIIEVEPDVVVAWGQAASFATGLAVGRKSRIPWVAYVDEPPHNGSWLVRLVAHWLLPAPRVVLTASPELKQAWSPRQSKRLEVREVPAVFDPQSAEAHASDTPGDQVPADGHLILAVGPLERIGRVEELVWSADLLKSVRKDFVLGILGAGGKRAELARRIDALRVADRVRFLGHLHDWPGWLHRAAMYWDASHSPRPADVLVQALATGVPCVVADTPRNRAILTPGETGFLVDDADRAGFTRATKPLFEQPDEARLVAEAGRQWAERHHRPQHLAAILAEACQQLIANG